jgi:hypothetical protein
VAAGDAAVLAAAAEPPPPLPPAAAAPDAEVCVPVRAAAAQRRRYGAFSFVGPDAAPDAPPSALRGCSIDLAGPKARARTDPFTLAWSAAWRRSVRLIAAPPSSSPIRTTGGVLRRRAG